MGLAIVYGTGTAQAAVASESLFRRGSPKLGAIPSFRYCSHRCSISTQHRIHRQSRSYCLTRALASDAEQQPPMLAVVGSLNADLLLEVISWVLFETRREFFTQHIRSPS